MKKFTSFCIKNGKFLLTCYFLFVLFFIGTIGFRLISKGAVIDNSVGVWFMQDDPELIHYVDYNANFGEQEWSILMVETESIYKPLFLRDLDRITNQIQKLKHIKKVTSITNVRDNEASEESLNYVQLYTKNEENSNLRKKLESNPVFINSLIKPRDHTSTVILIQNDNLINNPEPYRIQMVDSINKIMAAYPSVKKFSLAGTTIVNAELNRASQRDVLIFYTAISLLITVFGWLALRRIKDLLVMFAVVVGTVVPTMGALALFEIPYNMVTLMMPTILIAVSVLDIIHLISDFHLERRELKTKDAIFSAVEAVWKPGFWTSFGTVIGFLSLSVSSVYPIFQLGIFISAGVVFAWVITMTIGPVLLNLFYAQNENYVPKKIVQKEPFIAKLIPLVNNYKWIWLSLAIVLMLPIIFIYKIEVDTNYTKFFGSNTNISKSYNDIKEKNFGQNPINITITYPTGKNYASEKYFKSVLDFEASIKKMTEVIKLMSPNDLIKQVDKAYNGNYTSDEKFRNYNEQQVSQLVLTAEMSGNDDLFDLMTKDQDRVQLVAMTDYLSSNEVLNFKNRILAYQDKHLPKDLKVVVTGTSVLWGNMDKQISHTQVFSVWGTVVFLMIFFPVIFRSWKLSLIAIALNGIPILITYGIMGYLNIKINIATALIGGIALGIASDDTIHFLSRFKQGLKEGLGWDESIDHAVIACGNSVIITSIILIGAFFSMFTSDYLPTSHFGILVSWCILIAVYFDIFVLPTLLRMIKPAKYKKAKVRLEAEVMHS